MNDMSCDVSVLFLTRGRGHKEVCVSYMTAHWVAPQQSLMMATPDLVMDGLLGGGSGICLLGFGGPCYKEKKRWSRCGTEKWATLQRCVCVCFQTWSLTLCDFELLLQRDQLESEELRHLLVLLSLPEFETQSHSQPLEHTWFMDLAC